MTGPSLYSQQMYLLWKLNIHNSFSGRASSGNIDIPVVHHSVTEVAKLIP